MGSTAACIDLNWFIRPFFWCYFWTTHLTYFLYIWCHFTSIILLLLGGLRLTGSAFDCFFCWTTFSMQTEQWEVKDKAPENIIHVFRVFQALLKVFIFIIFSIYYLLLSSHLSQTLTKILDLSISIIYSNLFYEEVKICCVICILLPWCYYQCCFKYLTKRCKFGILFTTAVFSSAG